MTSTGYSDFGEEWAQKNAFRQDTLGTRDATLEVLLYDDSTDTITDSDDVAAVTTEPTDGNYTRQSITLDSSSVTITQEGGDIRAEGVVTFDVTDTTGTVDSTMCLIDFQSDVVNNETAQNTHHIFSDDFDIGSQDLSNFTSIETTIRLELS